VTDNELSVNERLVHEGLATGLTVHKVVEKKVPESRDVEEINCKCKLIKIIFEEDPSPIYANVLLALTGWIVFGKKICFD